MKERKTFQQILAAGMPAVRELTDEEVRSMDYDILYFSFCAPSYIPYEQRRDVQSYLQKRLQDIEEKESRPKYPGTATESGPWCRLCGGPVADGGSYCECCR